MTLCHWYPRYFMVLTPMLLLLVEVLATRVWVHCKGHWQSGCHPEAVWQLAASSDLARTFSCYFFLISSTAVGKFSRFGKNLPPVSSTAVGSFSRFCKDLPLAAFSCIYIYIYISYNEIHSPNIPMTVGRLYFTYNPVSSAIFFINKYNY